MGGSYVQKLEDSLGLPKPKAPNEAADRVPCRQIGIAAGYTDRLVKLSADLLEPDAEGEAHEHLSKECPWYQTVGAGGNPTDWAHCQAADGPVPKGPGVIAKFTPRTAEASTVPEPTVPPGGPGLFHIKGRQLPPYVQHLWHHLAPKYGKHKAYGMAVGIVKKWAQGIHPGGKKGGKQGHVHADVQAAASKNVAEWEKDRADAHKQSAEHERGKVRATVTLTQDQPFPGQEQITLPPVPRTKVTKAMYTAHRLDDTISHLAHADERIIEAKASKALRSYHMMHVNNHLSSALESCHNLVDSVRRNYLPEAAELEALNKTLGLAKAVSPDAKAATFAHLLQTLLYHLAHAKRHAALMLAIDPDAVWQFNFDHASVHLKGAQEHSRKLAAHVMDNYPEEAKFLAALGDEYDYGKLAACTQPGEIISLGMQSVTAPGAKPFLLSPPPGGNYSQYGLWQHPSQTTAPSPPLPPAVRLPTPCECRAIAAQVPGAEDITLSNTARKFLDQAAGKLEKNDVLQALVVLRSAQTALRAAHKSDIAAGMPSMYTANIFTKIPAAEQSSANASVLETRDKAALWRKLELETNALITRIRKLYFHGHYNGPSQEARFSTEDDMSALGKVLQLGQQQYVDCPDVSFPTKSDARQFVKLQQFEGKVAVTDPRAREELAAMPELFRLQIQGHLDSANAKMDNRASASHHIAAARILAKQHDAYNLALHLGQYLQALGEGENITHPADDAAVMGIGTKVIAPQHRYDDKPDTSGNKPGKKAALSAVDRVLLAAGAGTSAGTSAGRSTGAKPRPKPTKHQAHEAHLAHEQHLHHEHVEHVAHVAHLHVEHLRHMAHLRHTGAPSVGASISTTTRPIPGKKVP